MIELIDNKTGEKVILEPDGNGVITIPVGEWHAAQTQIIPKGLVAATRNENKDA